MIYNGGMMDEILPEQRRAQILEWLNERGSLTIDELARQFGVSSMTIHRDIDRLEKDGLARKVRGGVMPAAEAPGMTTPAQGRCAMCGKAMARRTAWIATTDQGEQWQACCAHCGLLRLHHTAGAQSVLAADFLFGQMVNAWQATFVLGSEVTLCCVPSVLCFATRHDAERYARGFGGELLDFREALAAMGDAHHGHDAGGRSGGH